MLQPGCRALDVASTRSGVALRGAAALLCAAVSVGLAAVVLSLPEPAPTLAPQAAANLPATGLGNPVTAVLLAYRAIDTFLEKVVLVLALVGVWSLAADRDWGAAPAAWRAPARDDVLIFLAQLLPPVGVVVAVYILVDGSQSPGRCLPGKRHPGGHVDADPDRWAVVRASPRQRAP